MLKCIITLVSRVRVTVDLKGESHAVNLTTIKPLINEVNLSCVQLDALYIGSSQLSL